MIKTQRNVSGYDLEELYFEKLNRELIQNLKRDTASSGSGQEQTDHPGAQIIAFPKRQTESQKKAA